MKRKSSGYYPAKPYNIGGDVWCYAEPKGLCVVAQLGNSPVVMPRKLPWKFLERMLKIHKKASKP